MIEAITRIYTDLMAMSNGNPVVAGAVSLWGLTVVTYLARDIPSRLWRAAKHWTTSELTIHSWDGSYNALLTVLSRDRIKFLTRAHSMSSGETDADYLHQSAQNTISMGMGEGSTVVLRSGRLFLVERRVLEANATTGRKETLRVVTMGRSPKPFYKMAEDAALEMRGLSGDHVALMKHNGHYWSEAAKTRGRPMSSVSVPAENRLKITSFVKGFLEREDWSREKAVPWRTGLFLYGPPGTGKSSMILAIASEFRLPIYYLSLSSMSDRDLSGLVSSVPPRSLIVIEDIDVGGRKTSRGDKDTDGASLSGLLNAIDGIGAGEGRIVIATSNNRESLDPALIRTGRFDLSIEMGYMTTETLYEMMDRFFSSVEKGWDVKEKTSPSDVQAEILSGTNALGILKKFAEKK